MKKLLVLFLLGLSFTIQAQNDEESDRWGLGPLRPTPPPPPPIQLYVPNFITPNNDGVNDKFVLEIDPQDRVELRVYSRWGNLIYSSDDYKNNYSPTNIADGVYAFWIRIYVGNRYEDFQEMVTIIK